MKNDKSTFILLKLLVGVLLVGIVLWPLWVCLGDVIELFSEITNGKELNVNISAVWIIVLYVFFLFVFGMYLIYISITELRNHITRVCCQYNINKRGLILIKLKQFLSPMVYVGLIESIFIYIFPVHLILTDRILLPAALLYSIYRKFISSHKRWEFLGLFIIVINHIIIHILLDTEPWYAKYFFDVLEKLVEFYNI